MREHETFFAKIIMQKNALSCTEHAFDSSVGRAVDCRGKPVIHRSPVRFRVEGLFFCPPWGSLLSWGSVCHDPNHKTQFTSCVFPGGSLAPLLLLYGRLLFADVGQHTVGRLRSSCDPVFKPTTQSTFPLTSDWSTRETPGNSSRLRRD